MHRGEVERLYRTYGPAVRRRARAILGDDEAAEDVMHDVFVKTLRVGEQFRGEASPMTWMYRITTNECLNLMRNRATRARLLAAEARNEATTPSETSDARLALRRVLDRVAPELCEIAIYYYVDQMNQDEIAAILGVSRRTVGNRLDEFRAAAGEATAADARPEGAP
jgi:RNA polymerase sigma-70 factor (ECF subfamily)